MIRAIPNSIRATLLPSAVQGDGAAFARQAGSAAGAGRRRASTASAPPFQDTAPRPDLVLIGREEYRALSKRDSARFRGVEIEVVGPAAPREPAHPPFGDAGAAIPHRAGDRRAPPGREPDLYLLVD